MPTENLSSPPKPVAPLVPIHRLTEVTDGQLRQYADLVYRRTGIRLAPQKKTLLSNRVRRRLRATGISGFSEYFEHLKGLPSGHAEWDGFLQEITTHETYLFRDEAQWQWFSESYLPQIAAEARDGSRRRSLRIWSAACSTGDEAYTAACCIAACLPNCQQWQVRIQGTDIGVGAVAQAQGGRFQERAMRLVPEPYRKRFFAREIDGSWRARPLLTQMVSFRQHNLLDPLRQPPFDVVIVKNVLIYFDAASKERVMANVREAMRPGGVLVAGPAEGISEMVRDLLRLKPWLYQRPQH